MLCHCAVLALQPLQWCETEGTFLASVCIAFLSDAMHAVAASVHYLGTEASQARHTVNGNMDNLICTVWQYGSAVLGLAAIPAPLPTHPLNCDFANPPTEL